MIAGIPNHKPLLGGLGYEKHLGVTVSDHLKGSRVSIKLDAATKKNAGLGKLVVLEIAYPIEIAYEKDHFFGTVSKHTHIRKRKNIYFPNPAVSFGVAT